MRTSDSLYAKVGRLLTVATAFEASARSLLLDLAVEDTEEPNLEQRILDYIRSGNRIPLERVLAAVGSRVTTVPDLEATLREARLARNEVAHRLTLCIVNDLHNPKVRAKLEARIRVLHHVLSEARWLLRVIGIVRRNGGEPSPTDLEAFRSAYVRPFFDLESL